MYSWADKIPEDVVKDMAEIAPMLKKFGYDPNANPPKYAEPDQEVLDNINRIKENQAHYNKMAKKVKTDSKVTFISKRLNRIITNIIKTQSE